MQNKRVVEMWRLLVIGLALVLPGAKPFRKQPSTLDLPSLPRQENLHESLRAPWSFAASGDSRDCGDVVMPAIAAGALKHRVKFYWHLGDFRKIYDFDEDMQHEPAHRKQSVTIIQYQTAAWNDFIQHQILPFGRTPVFLGIGNHELILPKTRKQYLAQFADWLDAPLLRDQRLKDDPSAFRIETYYHWIVGPVDFISLDNGSSDQFDSAQVKWFEKVLARDEQNPHIRTLVVGMHRALPYSISLSHSMNESPAGTESGVRVYRDLLEAHHHARKRVYLLASHSHYFMENAFNTPYWRAHGGVLPGWIVGTAGAVRYPLPPDANEASQAVTHVYGYLVGTVNPPGSPEGTIQFKFYKIEKVDIPAPVVETYTSSFVDWCFDANAQGAAFRTSSR
ncbi:MAG TPA: hypothetical protein VKW70_08810 [Terriglobia bacterium]|nr:hypothetical protein [Terriglobia bacterium]